MFELISQKRDDFWIRSVDLVKVLKDSGIAEKQHYHVMRDIDRMFEANQRMVSKFGSVTADGSCYGPASEFGCISEVKSVHQKDASNLGCISEVPGMYLSTYSDAYGNDRRCWMLDERRVIQLCAGYSEEVRWYVVEWLHSLHEYYQLREEEDMRIMIEHTEKLESTNKEMARDLELLTFRELKWKELTATQVAQFIREHRYEIDSSDSTFSPSVIDLNNILFKMGLIGYRTHFNQKRPNPASVQQKFYDQYPGVPLAQKFGQAMTFCASEAAFAQLLTDLKSFGIKNNIGIKK